MQCENFHLNTHSLTHSLKSWVRRVNSRNLFPVGISLLAQVFFLLQVSGQIRTNGTLIPPSQNGHSIFIGDNASIASSGTLDIRGINPFTNSNWTRGIVLHSQSPSLAFNNPATIVWDRGAKTHHFFMGGPAANPAGDFYMGFVESYGFVAPTYTLSYYSAIRDGNPIGSTRIHQNLIVNSNGLNRVAIGLNQPTEQLHTNAGVRFEGLPLMNNPVRMVVQDLNGVLGYASFNSGGSNITCNTGNFIPKVNLANTSELICSNIFNANNGRVGIGTTSHRTTLHVNGQSLFLTGGNGSGIISGEGNGLRLFGDNVNMRSQIFSFDYASGQPTPLLLQNPGGSVGVGMMPGIWTGGGANIIGAPTNPTTVRLDINGMIRSTTAVIISDQNYKTDVRKIENALDKMLGLNGVSYAWRVQEFPDLQLDNYRHYGFIAQNVSEVLPESVGEDEKGFLSVDYNSIVPVLVDAIKVLQDRIEQLELEAATVDGLNESSNSISGASGGETMKVELFQNRPNPFSTKTNISWSVVGQYSKAVIMITTLSGQAVRNINSGTNAEGLNNLEVDLSELADGIYLYSIVIDGNVYGTKNLS